MTRLCLTKRLKASSAHWQISPVADLCSRHCCKNINRSTTEGFEPEQNSPPLPNSQGSSQRDFSFTGSLDNMNPGGRYDNAELSSYTKVLINSPSIKLPKLQSKGDYKAWKSEMPLHFEQHLRGDITYGVERYDEAEELRPLSLSVDLRTTFKIDDIREHMYAAAMLYARITQHFEAGDGINPDYLLQDLVTRKLQPNESVTTYVEDIARKFAEWQHASLLLSNCVEKFHDLAREHEDWIINHDRKTLSLAEALRRLRAAEHQRAQLRVQIRQPALLVAQVSADQGQGQGPRSNHKRIQKQHKRNKFVADKKQRTSCANCPGEGHWYSECTANTGVALRSELLAKRQEKK
ncbi:hypothetical protein PHMEG_00034790 [Phytophthora megakarya]|uniref:Uncharacterized protein n=1 Tax=Phytophthora megakarya TaxID=4795 RepID=A0A225UQG3_9STRA|nr:hypothetical protein PHMEG_00034790 [Phytophthora megakarya]